MTGGTLHVTNGDSVLYTFRKAGLVGTQIAWKDVLHEGPVPFGKLEDVSSVRALYLGFRGYGSAIKLRHDFELRDAKIRKAGDYDEVVLWFEHDLYDQLQLLQILATLGEMNLDPGKVSLVQSDHYLGMLDVSELMALFPKRRTVTAGVFASARSAWGTFTGNDARAFERIAQEDRLGLPFLRPAFARLCEEFPDGNGLSRSQMQALEAVARGPGRNDELFGRSQALEEASFMGDASFLGVLRDLAAAPAPVIEGSEGAYAASALGRTLLAGDGDWLEHQPVDRYIGGVQITNAQPWRYDRDARRFR